MGDSVNPSDPGRSAFVPGLLGTLRSELDEGTELDWAFGSLEASVSAVRAAYLAHRLPPHVAAVLLTELRLTGSDGAEWTVGATSGNWWRKAGGQWEMAGAPEGIRVIGDVPSWVANGIGKEIAAAENAARAAFGGEETVVVAPAPIVVTPLSKPERATAEDEINWLLQEWNSGPSALPQAPSVPKIGGTEMPGYIPTPFQPAAGLDLSIDALTGQTPPPAPRASSNIDKVISDVEDHATYRQTERDGFVLPQEFFLAPDPVEHTRDALDDEIDSSSSAWADMRPADPSADQHEPVATGEPQGPRPITLDDVLAVGRAAHAAARAERDADNQAADLDGSANDRTDATRAGTPAEQATLAPGMPVTDGGADHEGGPLYDPTRDDDTPQRDGYL